MKKCVNMTPTVCAFCFVDNATVQSHARCAVDGGHANADDSISHLVHVTLAATYVAEQEHAHAHQQIVMVIDCMQQ